MAIGFNFDDRSDSERLYDDYMMDRPMAFSSLSEDLSTFEHHITLMKECEIFTEDTTHHDVLRVIQSIKDGDRI